MDVLSEVIECSVCLERMDTKSRVLPCQHTFCIDCLHRISLQNKNELKCPECRCICTIPVRELPPNILLIRLLEGLKTAGKSVSTKRELLLEAGRPCAEAMYSYEAAQEPGDLKFRRGDLIYLKKKLDENWFYGELNGKSGYLPATYVKVICPFDTTPQPRPLSLGSSPSNLSANQSETPTSSPSQAIKVTAKALYDFEMKEEEKEDCLKFKKDEFIQLIRRVDQNWAEGKLHGAIGIFPLNYVKLSEAGRAFLDAPISKVTAGSARTPQPSRTRNMSGPAVFQSSPYSNHNGSTEVPQCQGARGDRHSVGSGSNSFNISSSAPTETSWPSAVVESIKFKRKSKELDGERVEVETKKQSSHNIYQALYNYKPQKDDELLLSRGSFYQVVDRCKDGWYRGKCVLTGSSGVFPGNYVQLVPPETDSASGDAQRTIRRGRLEPPTEKCIKTNKSANQLEEGSVAKVKGSVRQNVLEGKREGKRSSSLSRIEKQADPMPQPSTQITSRVDKPSDVVTKPQKATRMRYVCVMAYSSQNDLEIDLKIGDVVVVLKKKSEGYYKGTNETSGKTGVFPARFVESCASKSSSNNESRSS